MDATRGTLYGREFSSVLIPSLHLLHIVSLFRVKVISHSCVIATDVACFIWQLARLNSELPISLPALSRAYQTESSSENVFVHIDDARNLANIARDAVHEFASLANSDGLLWISVPGGSLEILNVMAYLQAFPGQSSAMEVQMMEATRANSVIMMGSKNIVDFLMDAVSNMVILMDR
jgi:hypothetical protein